MGWTAKEFINRIGIASYGQAPVAERDSFHLGKLSVDPQTGGIVGFLSSERIDARGQISLKIQYYYERPNGQRGLINLLDVLVEVDEEIEKVEVLDVYYKNKSLLSDLDERNVVAKREILLDTIKNIHLHLREGREPQEVLKLLYDANVHDVVQEELHLPGVDKKGDFFFPLTDKFNARARGDLNLPAVPGWDEIARFGEVNSLDVHRSLKTNEQVFGTNIGTGVTFEMNFSAQQTEEYDLIEGTLNPRIIPQGERARGFKDFVKIKWQKAQEKAPGQELHDIFSLDSFSFLNRDLSQESTETKIKAYGIYLKMMDMLRRQRFPKILDYVHLYDYLKFIDTKDPPPPEGRFWVKSVLGNGKEEIAEDFGYDLGACKIVGVDYYDEKGRLKHENIILDAGILLPPKGSDWDGALPDIIAELKDCKGIFISHRHLDHMAALVYLARLGLLRDIPIYGSERALYILEQQIKAEVGDDKSFIPLMKPLTGEGILDFDRISVEYAMDAMDHSTPASAYRAVGRKTDQTRVLKQEDVYGSYFFYGDGRKWKKPDFAARGLHSFGVNRQDTLVDVDLTNAKKAGHAPNEEEATQNRLDLMELFPDKGYLISVISTNDTKLNTYYDILTSAQRDFTAVGHNIEMTFRSHNIKGVDPEYKPVWDKNNVNEYLMHIARKRAEDVSPTLWSAYNALSDPEDENQKSYIYKQVIKAGGKPVPEEISDPITGKIKMTSKQKQNAAYREIYDILRDHNLLPIRYSGRTSQSAHNLVYNPSRSVIFTTGTQGNDAEYFATSSKFADGISLLDADRHTALKIPNPGDWVWVFDQTAIPGNAQEQEALVQKLITNRKLHAVILAVEDGYKIYGHKAGPTRQRIESWLKNNNIHYYELDNGCLVTAGVPLHVSGHAYKKDIEEICDPVKADIYHGTHSNNPENTAAFHIDVCQKNGWNHTERQFDNYEAIQIEMGSTPQESRLTSLGRDNSSIILFKLIRRFGDFFGGSIKTKRAVKFDEQAGYGEVGLTAGGINEEFEGDVMMTDFHVVSAANNNRRRDRKIPEETMTSGPIARRRFRGVEIPVHEQLSDQMFKEVLALAA